MDHQTFVDGSHGMIGAAEQCELNGPPELAAQNRIHRRLAGFSDRVAAFTEPP
jgi:hypothetical protein